MSEISAHGRSIQTQIHCMRNTVFWGVLTKLTHTLSHTLRKGCGLTKMKALHLKKKKKVVVRLPGPDPLQGALAGCDRCPLVRLGLWGAAEAAHAS